VEKDEAIIRKMTRISKENNMRRTNRSITRIKSWTNKILTHKKKESRDPLIS
jgi:hypothetical protein